MDFARSIFVTGFPGFIAQRLVAKLARADTQMFLLVESRFVDQATAAVERQASSTTVSVTVRVPSVGYVCWAVTPVAVVPSPKSQEYSVSGPSGSVDALASKLHARSTQVVVKRAVGAALADVRSVPITIDHTTPRALSESLVAVRPPAGPAPTGPLSAIAATTRPEPVPTA